MWHEVTIVWRIVELTFLVANVVLLIRLLDKLRDLTQYDGSGL